MSRSALFSIHPVHLCKMLAGDKKFEYRKIMPKEKITCIVFYSTAPVKKIVAFADVLGVVVGSPTRVWKETSCGSGISRKYYRSYFSGCNKANAFVLGDIYEIAMPLDISDLKSRKKPPQSFYYLDEIDMALITKSQSLERSK